MIDLTKLNEVSYDIKLNESLIINIKKPNNLVYNELFRVMEVTTKSKDVEKMKQATYEFLTMMLNRNKNEKVFSIDEVEDLFPLDVALYVIKDYQEWSNKSIEVVKNF